MSSHLKKFFFLASFLTVASFNISASEYPFMSIPAQLVKNANATRTKFDISFKVR